MDLVVEWDAEKAVYRVGETDTHLIEICPMIYNHRVVMTPKSSPLTWDWGWCYPDLASALLAVAAWDPVTQLEPSGYMKRVGLPLPSPESISTVLTPMSESASISTPAER